MHALRWDVRKHTAVFLSLALHYQKFLVYVLYVNLQTAVSRVRLVRQPHVSHLLLILSWWPFMQLLIAFPLSLIEK